VSTQRIVIEAPPADVFAVLLDPYTYPEWLVGARRIRSVDDNWAEPGSAFHHVVGVGPIKIADSTRVVTCSAPSQLELDARARPIGRARVRFSLQQIADDRTEVALEETPTSPILRSMTPLLESGIAVRNDASLKRLRSFVVDRRAR
jgi:uncharacterized protein YndB with AHSA1/START domain